MIYQAGAIIIQRGELMAMADKTKETLHSIGQKAYLNLSESILPFWTRYTWDKENGGFLTRLDRKGNLLESNEKHLMMQARMIWSLSAAHQFGIVDKGYQGLADKAFKWLVEKYWDQDQDGFFFTVKRDGAPLDKRKNTDVHAYTLTGISQYYMASQNKGAIVWGNRVFELLMKEAKDREFGFIEEFDGIRRPMLNDEQMDLAGRTDIKTIDMHINMLEGFYYLYRSTGDPEHRKALRDILELIAEHGISPEHGSTITAFDYNWQPVTDSNGSLTTSYGLNLELAWLMMEVVEILAIDKALYQRKIYGLIDHALEFGFDELNGGVASYGPATGNVADSKLPRRCLLKAWWEQAEALNAFLAAYEHTKDSRYLNAFTKTFEWCWEYQIDHECGDWYQDIDPDTNKPVTTEKGSEFKTAFHVTRAMIRICDTIQRME
jgi:mannobiose 2-epimerase